MIVVNKQRTSLINMDHISCIYMGVDGSLKANYAAGDGCQIARYNTPEEGETALAMLLESIGKTEVFYCPNDEAVRARIAASGQKYHRVTGKKTKSHGGS